MSSKYRILAVMCFAQLAAGLVWGNYPAILPILIEEWSLTGASAGLIISAFQAGYVIAVLPLGFLSDKLSVRKVYIISAIATSIAGVCSAFFAQGFYSAFVVRLLVGLGQGGLYVPGLKLLSQWFPSKERGKALGIFTGFMAASHAGSLYLAPPIVVAYNWHLAVLLTSVWGLLGAALVFYLVEDRPMVEVEQKTAQTQSRLANIGEIKNILTKKHVVLLNAGYFGHMWEMYGLFGWAGPFMVAVATVHGFQDSTALIYGNTIAATTIIMGAFSPTLGGAISDKIGRTMTVIIILLISAACALSIGWLVGLSLFGFIITVMLIFGFFSAMDSAVFKAGLSEMVEFKYLGFALGAQSFLGFGASVIAPAVFGWVLDVANPGFTGEAQFQVWGWSFTVIGIGAIAGAAAIYLLRRRPESFNMVGGKR